jgi:hypothetical protein
MVFQPQKAAQYATCKPLKIIYLPDISFSIRGNFGSLNDLYRLYNMPYPCSRYGAYPSSAMHSLYHCGLFTCQPGAHGSRQQHQHHLGHYKFLPAPFPVRSWKAIDEIRPADAGQSLIY